MRGDVGNDSVAGKAVDARGAGRGGFAGRVGGGSGAARLPGTLLDSRMARLGVKPGTVRRLSEDATQGHPNGGRGASRGRDGAWLGPTDMVCADWDVPFQGVGRPFWVGSRDAEPGDKALQMQAWGQRPGRDGLAHRRSHGTHGFQRIRSVPARLDVTLPRLRASPYNFVGHLGFVQGDQFRVGVHAQVSRSGPGAPAGPRPRPGRWGSRRRSCRPGDGAPASPRSRPPTLLDQYAARGQLAPPPRTAARPGRPGPTACGSGWVE